MLRCCASSRVDWAVTEAGKRLLIGEDALDALPARLEVPDASSSSHWREMHRHLSIENREVVSALGFGGFARPYRGLRKLGHALLQRRYRGMAQVYPDFERLDQLANTLVARQNRAYDLDVLRQTATAALLSHYVPEAFDGQSLVVVIGDGFGSLATLLAAGFPTCRLLLINLTQTLLVDLLMLRKGLAEVDFALAEDADSLREGLNRPDLRVLALRADDQALIATVPLVAAVNVASMQEMRMETIAGYIAALRASPSAPVPFYCCNREEKHLPNGETIRFADYSWDPEDEVLLDELCPWHQEYYTLRPPFYHLYDGPHQHRLVLLAASPAA